MERADAHSQRASALFWVCGILLVGYVALCTGNRDSSWGADAWEHHRAVLALTHDLWQPGNPTYAAPEPSIRYSPYTVVLAVICRWTGLDPYRALSFAAVFNTALMVAGVWYLLRVYKIAGAAAYVLLVMVGLYGTVPGYANSYALADLPWQQVNPSAPVFAVGLFMWAQLRRWMVAGRGWQAVIPLAAGGAFGVLTHAHTAVFVFIVMGCIAVTLPREFRIRAVIQVAVVSIATFGICLLWPWFNFLQAVRSNQDSVYWYNPFILKVTFFEWCAPALLIAPLLLSLRRHEIVRWCLLGAVACYGLGLAAFVVHSSVLVRLPLPALFLLHLPIGLYIREHRLLHPSSWRGMIHGLLRTDFQTVAAAYAGLVVLVLLVFCAVPQLLAIPRDPLLARSYVAPLLGKEDKQLRLRSTFAQLLEPVGERDTVLSDVVTSWPVPSIRGRVVAGLHFESFVPDQRQREQAVRDFFAGRDDRLRDEILDRYQVRWILLNTDRLDEAAVNRLLEPAAVVSRTGNLILMDAQRWRESRHPRA